MMSTKNQSRTQLDLNRQSSPDNMSSGFNSTRFGTQMRKQKGALQKVFKEAEKGFLSFSYISFSPFFESNCILVEDKQN